MSAAAPSTHRLGPVDAIPPGEGRAFTVAGSQVAVFRLRDGDRLLAMDAVCPHAGGPLADAQSDRSKIVCPLHNYSFSVADGSCLNGDFAVRVYPVREEDGQVVVEV